MAVHRRDLLDCSGACIATEVGRPEQHRVAAVVLGQLDVDGLGQRGRQVLADVVGPDRQLAVAAVDQHGELHGARAGRGRTARRARRGSCGRRTARRRRGRPSCRRPRSTGISVSSERADAVQPQVVAVHGDVERADRHVAVLDRRRSAAAIRRASAHAAGRDAEQHEVVRRRGCARRSRARCGSARGRRRWQSRTGRAALGSPVVGRGGRLSSGASAGQSSPWVPPCPPHGTGLKGRRSNRGRP